MLIEKYVKRINRFLLPIELIKPYPTIEDREKWDCIDNISKEMIIKNADKYNDILIKPLKGTMIIDACLVGNNSKIRELYQNKINALTAFTLAECVDNKDKYTEKALDVAWSIFDMAIWYLPNKAKVNIYDVNSHIIDEAATTLGYALAYSYYLLKDKFNQIDINIEKRFKYEIQKRIMNPFMDDEQNKNIAEDNMNYIIFPFLIFEDDYEIRHEAIKKSMKIMDLYMYSLSKEKNFSHIVACSLIKYLDMLYMATGTVFDIFEEDLICKIKEKHKTNSCYTFTDMNKNNLSIETVLYHIFNGDTTKRGVIC